MIKQTNKLKIKNTLNKQQIHANSIRTIKQKKNIKNNNKFCSLSFSRSLFLLVSCHANL